MHQLQVTVSEVNCVLLVQMSTECWRRQLVTSGAITASEVREALRRFTQGIGPFAIFSV